MDPVSAVASIWTILEATRSLGKLTKKAYQTRGATREIEQAGDILALIRIELDRLRSLKDFLSEQTGAFSDEQSSPLTDTVVIVEGLLSSISQTFPDVENSGTSKRKILKWTFRDKELVSNLLARLNDVENLLFTILQMEQM